MKSLDKKGVLIYAQYKCPNCNVYQTLRWYENSYYLNQDHSKWKRCRCWNCKTYYSRKEIELNILCNYEIIKDPSPLAIRQSIQVYDESKM